MKTPLQRRITLIRHAKAEDDGVCQDHLRRLNPRGQGDAAALGAWLKKQAALPELFVCSTAQRTRETLGLLAVNVPVILSEKAYLASAGELLGLLQQTDDAITHVALIGHNPGLHQLAVTLADQYENDADSDKLMLKFPTCGLVSMIGGEQRWQDLAPDSCVVDRVHFGND